MKITIRENAFETNSSSIHAIVINRTAPRDIHSLDNLTQCFEPVGEFGWEPERYDMAEEKLDYLLQAIYATNRNGHCEDRLKEILGLDQNLEFLPPSGYVDHDFELDDFVSDLFNDEELMKDFIYGTDSFVDTGNDNSEYHFPRFYIEQAERIEEETGIPWEENDDFRITDLSCNTPGLYIFIK